MVSYLFSFFTSNVLYYAILSFLRGDKGGFSA